MSSQGYAAPFGAEPRENGSAVGSSGRVVGAVQQDHVGAVTATRGLSISHPDRSCSTPVEVTHFPKPRRQESFPVFFFHCLPAVRRPFADLWRYAGCVAFCGSEPPSVQWHVACLKRLTRPASGCVSDKCSQGDCRSFCGRKRLGQGGTVAAGKMGLSPSHRSTSRVDKRTSRGRQWKRQTR